MRKKILHIVGSLNQTRQLYKISQEMPGHDHYFTQFFGSGPVFKWIAENGFADFTVMGTNSAFRRDQNEFLEMVGARYDYRGSKLGYRYDLVFICSDLIVPREIRYSKIIFVQEGMTDPLSIKSKIFKKLRMPAWTTGDTSLNGTSNMCDIYCVASDGYARFFSSMGTDRRKIVVTGIPNFDNAAAFLQNDFPYKGYVLVCTSDVRETGRFDDRIAFLERCKDIAEGRQIIFKLHPNEKVHRAQKEIQQVFGEDIQVFAKGNTDYMIANCTELITQYSSVVYIGMALGKKVHSYFSMDELAERIPLQNGGTSAKKIAGIAEKFLNYNGTGAELLNSMYHQPLFTNENPVFAGE